MDNTAKFTGKAALYDRYRPGYPAACIRDIMDICDLQQGDRVADVGAGSGIFTEALLANGLYVWAVEPNADMGRALQCRLQEKDGWQLTEAPAENTGLPAHSVKAVTVAQAFHWFDAPRFQNECRRILQPGGRVALVWNSRDKSSPLVQELHKINTMYCPEFKGFSGGQGADAPEVQAFFGGEVRMREFPNPLPMDIEGFLGRNLSASYAPKPGEATYEPFVRALSELFEKWSSDGKVIMPNLTRSYIGALPA